MALFRESATSIRILFFVFGAFGVYDLLQIMTAPGYFKLFFGIGGAIGLVFLFSAFQLNKILRSAQYAQWLQYFLWGNLTWSFCASIFVLGLKESSVGSETGSLLVETLIIWYLVKSVRRLSEEATGKSIAKEAEVSPRHQVLYWTIFLIFCGLLIVAFWYYSTK